MRVIAICLLGLVAAGCGGAGRPAQNRNAVQSSPDCSAAALGYRTCFHLGRRPATIERRAGSRWELVAGPLHPTDPTAQWGPKVWLSPDGKTVLAEWTFPCDDHLAVFVPARGGKPRTVTGERDWRKAPPSVPVGWTTSGKARVQLLRSWRGIRVTARHQPVVLFDPKAPSTDAHPPAQPGC